MQYKKEMKVRLTKMNTFQIANRLVKAMESAPEVKDMVDILSIRGKAESLAIWGQNGVRIHSNSGCFVCFNPRVENFYIKWLQANAPDHYGQPCDGGEVLVLYKI
jgi:hypothetical protein